jgi:hypothetical protein
MGPLYRDHKACCETKVCASHLDVVCCTKQHVVLVRQGFRTPLLVVQPHFQASHGNWIHFFIDIGDGGARPSIRASNLPHSPRSAAEYCFLFLMQKRRVPREAFALAALASTKRSHSRVISAQLEGWYAAEASRNICTCDTGQEPIIVTVLYRRRGEN